MSPVNHPGLISPWVHMRNFSPVSEMRKDQRLWGRVLAPNLRNKANMAKHKHFNFKGGDNSNKGCLGSPMNNVMSFGKFRRPSRIFSVVFSTNV